MCRLLAYVAPQPRSLRAAVDESTFATFRDLSRIHGDGWGMAWVTPGSAGPAITVRRSTTCAAGDPDFLVAATDVAARAAIAHLRWATEGMPVTPANTHPFLADGWAFAHNGFVRRSDVIESLLSDRRRCELTGTTDSERYFQLVLQCADRAGDMVAGIRQAAATIRESSGAVSINAMLLSPTRLLAVQGLTGATPPLDDLLALAEGPGPLPPDHIDGYLRLYLRTSESAVVIASSGVQGENWTELPADVVVDIDIATGELRLHPLLDESAAVSSGASAGAPAAPTSTTPGTAIRGTA